MRIHRRRAIEDVRVPAAQGNTGERFREMVRSALASPAVKRPASDRLMGPAGPHLRLGIGWRGDNPPDRPKSELLAPLDGAMVG